MFPLPLPEEWNTCLWLTEISWLILLFTLRCQTGSWYWWHCTVTTTDSTRYTDVLKLYHMSLNVKYSVSNYMWDILMKLYDMSLNVQYSVSICMWDILVFWNCITCHSMYNILFQYTCEIYWCSETVSHVTPCTIFNCNVNRPHTTTLSITMPSDSHVPYNQYTITANNVCISRKINSCLLPH